MEKISKWGFILTQLITIILTGCIYFAIFFLLKEKVFKEFKETYIVINSVASSLASALIIPLLFLFFNRSIVNYPGIILSSFFAPAELFLASTIFYLIYSTRIELDVLFLFSCLVAFALILPFRYINSESIMRKSGLKGRFVWITLIFKAIIVIGLVGLVFYFEPLRNFFDQL